MSARSATIGEANGRAAIYLSAVSSTLVAFGFLAQVVTRLDPFVAAVLPALWKRVLAGEDSRVQEKAWSALVEIIARSGELELLQQWNRTLTDVKQGARRLQLLTEVSGHWQKREDTRALAAAVAELLIPAQLDEGKWAAAFPLVREVLSRPGGDAELDRRLRWLLTVGEQAFKDGNRQEAMRVVQEVQTYLPRSGGLAGAFEELGKKARLVRPE